MWFLVRGVVCVDVVCVVFFGYSLCFVVIVVGELMVLV